MKNLMSDLCSNLEQSILFEYPRNKFLGVIKIIFVVNYFQINQILHFFKIKINKKIEIRNKM